MLEEVGSPEPAAADAKLEVNGEGMLSEWSSELAKIRGAGGSCAGIFRQKLVGRSSQCGRGHGKIEAGRTRNNSKVA